MGWGQSQITHTSPFRFERCNTHKHSRLGSHDALLLKWHLLPLSCLFRLSGSCHVRRAVPSLNPSPTTSDPETGQRGLGTRPGRLATGGGGEPCARLQANQFGN